MSSNKPKVLIVEGNIGAGKSTFLNMISKHLDVQPVYEPDQKWQNVGDGENLLDKFYQDPKRWAYTFQTYAFVTRVLEQELSTKKNPGVVQIIERSVYADRYCFARNCYEMGVLSALEWKLYLEWFTWLVDSYTVKPAGFIYLQTDPEVCYQRVLKRSRSAEKSVSLDYLKMLHQKHEEWLIEGKDVSASLRDVPVLTLPCNAEFEHNKEEQEKHVARIQEFFGIAQNTPRTKTHTRSVTL
jgi:deoxyadenosine/deoxycytidine kinase